MPKYLALGYMPQNAKPGEWLAAGPWCFDQREFLFPDWEKNFAFAPEPLANSSLLADAVQAAQTLALTLIKPTAAMLDENYAAHSPVYWETLLCPWTLALSRQIIERSMRVDALLKKYGDQTLQVELLPFDLSFEFFDENAFTLYGCLSPVWNHWLLSRFVEKRLPARWRVKFLEARYTSLGQNENAAKNSLKQTFKNALGRMQLELPFPRLKGMSITQALRYSFAIAHSCKSVDASLDLKKEFYRPQALAKFSSPMNLKGIVAKNIPLSIKMLKHDVQARKVKKPRLRIASIRAHEDAAYRQKLALWREGGNRLAFVQHGCNYGQVRVACDAPMLEYSQSVFFTWGWDKYSAAKGNFVPLSFPGLQALRKKTKNAGDKLVFVGTEMAASPYRLDSRPTPLQFVQYRNSKVKFFASLPEEIKKNSLYRPYFNLPGCLQDASWLLSRVEELKICEGALWPHIQNCRLLVLDHPGTTMLEALSCGVPMILFWDRHHWPLGEECDKLLCELEKCGVWNSSPEQAAEMVERIWPDPQKWFFSGQVQMACEHYRNWQAKVVSEDADAMWINELKKL